MDAFHSRTTSENTQNLSNNSTSYSARLNCKVLGKAYDSEIEGIREYHQIFDLIDEIFSASCSSYTEYRVNLDQLAEEYSEVSDRIDETCRNYRDGDDI